MCLVGMVRAGRLQAASTTPRTGFTCSRLVYISFSRLPALSHRLQRVVIKSTCASCTSLDYNQRGICLVAPGNSTISQHTVTVGRPRLALLIGCTVHKFDKIAHTSYM